MNDQQDDKLKRERRDHRDPTVASNPPETEAVPCICNTPSGVCGVGVVGGGRKDG